MLKIVCNMLFGFLWLLTKILFHTWSFPVLFFFADLLILIYFVFDNLGFRTRRRFSDQPVLYQTTPIPLTLSISLFQCPNHPPSSQSSMFHPGYRRLCPHPLQRCRSQTLGQRNMLQTPIPISLYIELSENMFWKPVIAVGWRRQRFGHTNRMLLH